MVWTSYKDASALSVMPHLMETLGQIQELLEEELESVAFSITTPFRENGRLRMMMVILMMMALHQKGKYVA